MPLFRWHLFQWRRLLWCFYYCGLLVDIAVAHDVSCHPVGAFCHVCDNMLIFVLLLKILVA